MLEIAGSPRGGNSSARYFKVAVVEYFMAVSAERDQIRFLIRALLTAELLVVNLQVLARAADLTLPPVPLHYPLPNLLVRVGL